MPAGLSPPLAGAAQQSVSDVMARRTHIFVDGENLVFRYQDMLKSGPIVRSGVRHITDVAAWSTHIYQNASADIQRVTYYTSCVGDDDYLSRIHDEIQQWGYSYNAGSFQGTGRLSPVVSKKPSKSQKSRSVDIRITLDALVCAYTHEIEQLILLTGDSDFVPVVEQVRRQGKQIIVGSFSSGLTPALRRVPDHFFLLDSHFFEKTNPASTAAPPPNAS